MPFKTKHKEILIEALIKSHQQKVFNLAYSIVRHEEEARDIVQDVFLKAFEHLDEFRGDAEITTWLYRITYNHSINMLKKITKADFARLMSEPDEQSDEEPTPWIIPIAKRNEEADFKVTQAELKSILWEALDKLPITQRTAFLLHHYDGFSYQEIAQIMNKSMPSVESLIFRARQELKRLLQNFYEQYKENSKIMSNHLSKN